MDLVYSSVIGGLQKKTIGREEVGIMSQVNVHEAKTHLSKLLTRVAAGEEIVISKAGKPVARLVPWKQNVKQRTPGLDSGLMTVPDDFDSPLPKEIMDTFES